MTVTSPPETPQPDQRRRQLAQLLREKARQSQTVYPASPAQRGVWFMQQMDPASHAYHLLFCARVLSPLDPDAAQGALGQLIDRHSMLRATFRSDGQQVEVVIQGAADPDFARIDAGEWSDEDLLLQVESTLRQPFDLQKGPLVRLRLFSRAETDHVFLLVVHHLVCDGASMGSLLEEFIECYQAALSGRAPVLTARTLDFPEFIRQQQERLAGPAGEKSKAYWLDKLAGEIPRLDLPTSHSFQEPVEVSSAIHFFEIDESLDRHLGKLAQSCGVTLFSLLLSIFQTLLMRLSGQEDIVIGIPMAGRTEPGYDGLVGHMVNLVPLRVDLSGEPSFRELTARTWTRLQGAIEHQEFPFSELVRLLRPNSRYDRYPFFRTCINILRPGPGDPTTCTATRGSQTMKWGPLKIAWFPVEALEEQYDLSLRIVEIGGRLYVKIQYDSMAFDAELISHFFRALVELMKSAIANPDLPITRLSILAPEDRERILVSWNDTSEDYPSDSALHEILAGQAAKTPDAIALVAGGTQLTYRELDQRANQLARYLRDQGIGRNDLVAVCADRSSELAIGLLATLKAGAAYLPVDPRYPADRVELMLQDSAARMILTTWNADEITRAAGAPRFCMDRDWRKLETLSREPLPSINDPLDPAYVIYTSGSTGRPRGVQIAHRSLVNFLCSMREKPGIAATDILLSVTTFSFDIFALELFLPLMAGARVEMAGVNEIVDGRLLAQRLAACGATIMQATPVTWRMLLEAGFRPSGPFKALCGGEALSPDLAAMLLAAGMELWNMYGPTETTVWSCIERVHDAQHRTVSIGRPIANTQAYVLDAHLEPVAVGVIGQLYLGGDGLARGYLNRPELTAERFVPSPFASEPHHRLYQTGDLARFLPDGRLECVGRTDHQVKIRGFRIELEEIEITLRKQEGVQAAVVVAQEGPNGASRLIAFLTGQFAQGFSSENLRQRLRSALPDYMVPSQFVLLPKLPLTPNGKIDRNALPLPAWGESAASAYAPPVNDVQVDLAEIFAQVLKVQRVGANDSFFDLGGDSLTAVTLAAQIKEKFARTITLAALFHAPTVAELAALIQDEAERAELTLMTMRQTGSKTPLFYLPGANGSSLPFRKVVQHFPGDRPVYACNFPMVEEDPGILTSVRAYALDVLRRIREVCPSGPFNLLGYSFGGYVAFEIAHVLQEQGETLPYLGMIDTWGPGFPSRNPMGRRVKLHFAKLRGMKTRDRVDYFQRRLKKAPEIARRAALKLKLIPAPRPSAAPAPLAPTPQQNFDNMLEVAAAALLKYNPRPLKSNLYFYRAQLAQDDGPGLSFEDPYNGWRKFVTGHFEVSPIPCIHEKVFEAPAVNHLAFAVIAHLESADAVFNGDAVDPGA